MTRNSSLLALSLLALAGPAFAQPATIAVEVDQYDLATDAGYAAAARRLDLAARRVCGTVDRRNTGATIAWMRCHAETLDRATRQLDERLGRGRMASAR